MGLVVAMGTTARAGDLDHRVEEATQVYRDLVAAPDRSVPKDLLERSRCIAVIPSVVKVAWFLGGRYGRGLLSCRRGDGSWSPPVMILMTGGSFGLQFGASSTDVALFFVNERSVRSLLESRFKLSGDAGVAAGPIGRTAEAATDLKLNAEIYSYARSRGLFAGVSLAGAYLGVDKSETADYYGRYYEPETILFGRGPGKVPSSAWRFTSALPGAGKF